MRHWRTALLLAVLGAGACDFDQPVNPNSPSPIDENPTPGQISAAANGMLVALRPDIGDIADRRRHPGPRGLAVRRLRSAVHPRAAHRAESRPRRRPVRRGPLGRGIQCDPGRQPAALRPSGRDPDYRPPAERDRGLREDHSGLGLPDRGLDPHRGLDSARSPARRDAAAGAHGEQRRGVRPDRGAARRGAGRSAGDGRRVPVQPAVGLRGLQHAGHLHPVQPRPAGARRRLPAGLGRGARGAERVVPHGRRAARSRRLHELRDRGGRHHQPARRERDFERELRASRSSTPWRSCRWTA